MSTGFEIGMSPGPHLSVSNLSVRFGGILALDGLSFSVERGQIVGIIGPNGAGKSTFFNCLSRLYTPVAGRIELNGVDLLQRAPHQVPLLGIGRTFQHPALFRSFSVIENIEIGATCGTSTLVRMLPAPAQDAETSRETVLGIARQLDLEEHLARPAAALPFAIQKRVELARALATRPTLILLDEPAAGLNHAEIVELAATIARVREAYRLTILLIEHNFRLVRELCSSVVALDLGRKIAEGPPAMIESDPRVTAAYLGTAA